MAAGRERVLVLGVGNPDRGDDAVGRLVARRLVAALPGGVEVEEHAGDGADLLARMSGADALYCVDACASGGRPGRVHRFDVVSTPLRNVALGVSTHAFGLGEALELARVLGRLPARAVVYAVEGASFAAGTAPSPAVVAAVDEVVERLRVELAAALAGPAAGPGRLGPA